jgi:hypothetical protein
MLTQQLRHEDNMHERNEPQYDEEGGIPNAAWLFLSRGADERAMYQVLTRDDIRESRRESRIMNKIYEDDWLDHCSYYEFFRGTYDRMLKFLEDGLAIANERIQEL